MTDLVSKILITDFGVIGFYELSRGGGGNRPQPPCPSLQKDWKSPPNRVGQQPLTLVWGNTVLYVASCLVYLYVRCRCSVYIWILLVRGSLNSVFDQSWQQGFIGTSGLWSFELHFWHFARQHCFCMISQDFLMAVYAFPCLWQWVHITGDGFFKNKFTDQKICVCVCVCVYSRHPVSAKKVLPTLTQIQHTNVSFIGFSVSVLIEVCFLDWKTFF